MCMNVPPNVNWTYFGLVVVILSFYLFLSFDLTWKHKFLNQYIRVLHVEMNRNITVGQCDSTSKEFRWKKMETNECKAVHCTGYNTQETNKKKIWHIGVHIYHYMYYTLHSHIPVHGIPILLVCFLENDTLSLRFEWQDVTDWRFVASVYILAVFPKLKKKRKRKKKLNHPA